MSPPDPFQLVQCYLALCRGAAVEVEALLAPGLVVWSGGVALRGVAAFLDHLAAGAMHQAAATLSLANLVTLTDRIAIACRLTRRGPDDRMVELLRLDVLRLVDGRIAEIWSVDCPLDPSAERTAVA